MYVMHMVINEILPDGSAEGTVVTDTDVVDVTTYIIWKTMNIVIMYVMKLMCAQ